MMMIYTVIFGVVFNAKEQFFPVFIFIGITMWSFFSRNISVSVGIVRENKGIITKIYMPKFILLLSRMLVNGFKMLVSFGVIALMMIVFQVPISVHIFEAVPILIVLFLFTFGIGTILMHYGVYVNDLGYITGIVLTKMDGTAKGGIAVAIQSELGIPVKYIGVGETIDDLQKFNSDDFVNALFATEE